MRRSGRNRGECLGRNRVQTATHVLPPGKMSRSGWIALFLLVLFVAPAPAPAQPLTLILPTSNDGLLTGDLPAFYQYTDRTFNGVRSRPWQGGQYGFVRNQKETSAGIVFTRFHEGLDIKPLFRDRNGEPQDTVRSIDAGRVVYVNPVERASSYGKYVVVEHTWSGMPFYSLYAHLGSTRVKKGAYVQQGEMLGRIGYTGRGINKRRAHVHFEINMMLNASFGRWHDVYFRGRNTHDIYNGINMAGLDVAALCLELQRDSLLTIERFLRRQAPYFTVRVPNEGALDMHFRYPWLSTSGYDPAAASLDITFSQSGLPVRIEPAQAMVADPTVVWASPENVDYRYVSSGMLTGSFTPTLSNTGRRYLHLLLTNARAPADLTSLAGRVLPPRAASQPVTPATARPAAQASSTERPAARSRIVTAPPAAATDAPDTESAGGEVRGW